MKIPVLAVILAVLAAPAGAQRQKLGTINTETPEGQLLQQIGTEADETKKLALLEQFAVQHPKHEGTGWVYAHLITAYTKGSQFDKAMETGEKLLALDPEDVENAHFALKAAEAKKDPDAVLKWAVRTSDVARKVAQLPKPADEDAAEEWKTRVDFAKQVDVYTDYSLYAMALQTTDPRKKLALADALEQRSPQSQYLPQLTEQRFVAYLQAGDNPKAIAYAEKVLEKDQSNADMLLAVAESYLSQKKEPDKVVALCAKALEVVSGGAKPQGMPDAEWEKKKTLVSGRARWMTGVVYATQRKWAQADQALRAALPGVKDNQRMTAEALFYLGLANYHLAEKGDVQRIRDAAQFNEQCAAIPSPFQGQARNNLKVIRNQYRGIK
jgi:tetratricopeptide (TPR) repeat protein